jgi:hypothetical protein
MEEQVAPSYLNVSSRRDAGIVAEGKHEAVTERTVNA